jgi:hypothetical protein
MAAAIMAAAAEARSDAERDSDGLAVAWLPPGRRGWGWLMPAGSGDAEPAEEEVTTPNWAVGVRAAQPI